MTHANGAWEPREILMYAMPDLRLAGAVAALFGGGTVWDLGAGNASTAAVLAGAGFDVRAFDGSPGAKTLVLPHEVEFLDLTSPVTFESGERPHVLLALDVLNCIPREKEAQAIANVRTMAGRWVVVSWPSPESVGFGSVNGRTPAEVVSLFCPLTGVEKDEKVFELSEGMTNALRGRMKHGKERLFVFEVSY